jgi:hypothetical protein
MDTLPNFSICETSIIMFLLINQSKGLQEIFLENTGCRLELKVRKHPGQHDGNARGIEVVVVY